MFITRRPQDADLIDRLDPGYWHPQYERVLAECGVPLVPLGPFIAHITYGAIVTGRRPAHDADGPLLLGQGALRHTGVDPSDCPRIAPDSPWVLDRTRVRPGDLLIARSGAGSLEKNRLAVYHCDEPAAVDCWVDIVRLDGIAPDFVAVFLKSRFGWPQIHRLINGVGPANLSFGEIRSLRVPAVDDALQEEVARSYTERVMPAHERREFAAALEQMRRLVRRLEAELEGEYARPVVR
ncbi:MAG: hypothetical protein ACOX9R_19075 [Armatimonadota bacterium]